MALQIRKRGSTVAPEDYIPEDHRNDPDPPKFRIRPLTGPQKLEVVGEFNERTQRITGHGMMLAVKYGVIGWSGIEDEDGNPVKFSPRNLELLPSDLLAELTGAILDKSTLDEEDQGN